MNDDVRVLTLDGPSGTGKGTVGRALAAELGWHYLDSGAIYRIFALLASEAGIAPSEVEELERFARSQKIDFELGEDDIIIRCNGRDRTADIRSETAGDAASRYAVIPQVRTVLLELQRRQARPPGLVADGRDMGTVVFPTALMKVFLTASPEIRLERRSKQLREKGFSVNLPQLRLEMAERDKRDATRKSAPMAAASDAIIIDTSLLTIDEVLGEIRGKLSERMST